MTYFYLILGVISLFVGVVSTCTGVVWARFGRVIHRDNQPKEFWEDLVAVISLVFVSLDTSCTKFQTETYIPAVGLSKA